MQIGNGIPSAPMAVVPPIHKTSSVCKWKPLHNSKGIIFSPALKKAGLFCGKAQQQTATKIETLQTDCAWLP